MEVLRDERWQDVAITRQQQKFIYEIAKGKSQIEAYRIAYPKSKKWTDNAASVNASRLYNKPEIKSEILRVKKQIEEDFINQTTWNVLESERVYKKMIALAFDDIKANGFRQANSTAIINANKELTEMFYRNRELYTSDQLAEIKINKEIVQTEKTKAEIDKIKGIAEEIEDLSETDALIFGDADE